MMRKLCNLAIPLIIGLSVIVSPFFFWSTAGLSLAQEKIASSEDIEELEEQIEAKNESIADLEKEIEKYEERIEVVGEKRSTLESTIANLENSLNKLTAEQSVLENEISAARARISRSQIEKNTTEEIMSNQKNSLAVALRSLYINDDTSLVEQILAYDSLSEAWLQADQLEKFSINIRTHLDKLRILRDQLETSILAKQQEQQKLTSLVSNLELKEQSVALAKAEQDNLLESTKSQEDAYQEILREKEARRNQFLQELNDLESELEIAINPELLPETQTQALYLPVSSSAPITQHFGNTPFATANAQVYNGNGHNGIDWGVPVGTSMKAAQHGKVVDFGNTDLACPGASYGKWILLEHENGLSTLYAHLSKISVNRGQSVRAGDHIGFSGNTGFSTGPHLHFTVYATQGVQVKSFPSKGCPGATYTMPIADLDAYLNPLSYLDL